MIGLSLKPARSAAYIHTAILALRKAGSPRARLGRMRHIVMNVSWNKQIQPAVAVIVAEARACGPVAERDARLLRHIGEGPIVFVVVQAVLSEVGYVEIGRAVVIVISHGDSETPSVIGHARRVRNIREGAIVIVMKESR